MQVLLLILVAAVMLPTTGDPAIGGAASIAIVLGAIAVLVVTGWGRAALLRRGLDRGDARRRLERAHASMRWMQRLAVIVVVIGIVALGFREAVRGIVGNPPLLDEAIVVMPAVATITLAWWIFHPFEQRAQDSMLLRRLDEGLPVQAPPARLAHVAMQVRSQLLVLLVPFALLLLAGESVRGWLESEGRSSSWTMLVAGVGVMAAVALVAPAIIVRLVGARPMPPGEVRATLESMCRTTGVRVRELLIWPTGGLVVNAAVTGLVARWRWVMLTDGLLETLRRDEVLAVMAHELGHVRRHHMAWLAIVVVAFAMGVGTLLDPAIQSIREWRWNLGGAPEAAMRDLEWIDLGATVVVLAVVMVGFGWVSRRFERQADAFAASCLSGFEAADVVASSRTALDPRGVGAMSSALSSVAEAGGVPVERFTWRHGSIASRRRHLQSLVGCPLDRIPIDRTVGLVKSAAIVVLAVSAGWWWIDEGPRDSGDSPGISTSEVLP